MRNLSNKGFGILESLLSLVLIGIVLAIVARAYQALNRLSVASYEMSQKLELSTFLRHFSYEVSDALEIEDISSGSVTFRRTRPGLHARREEPSLRLPWELPNPRPANRDLTIDVIPVHYFFDDAEKRVMRQQETLAAETVCRDVGLFTPSVSGRILTIEAKPKNMTASLITSIYLPAVSP